MSDRSDSVLTVASESVGGECQSAHDRRKSLGRMPLYGGSSRVELGLPSSILVVLLSRVPIPWVNFHTSPKSMNIYSHSHGHTNASLARFLTVSSVFSSLRAPERLDSRPTLFSKRTQ